MTKKEKTFIKNVKTAGLLTQPEPSVDKLFYYTRGSQAVTMRAEASFLQLIENIASHNVDAGYYDRTLDSGPAFIKLPLANPSAPTLATPEGQKALRQANATLRDALACRNIIVDKTLKQEFLSVQNSLPKSAGITAGYLYYAGAHAAAPPPPFKLFSDLLSGALWLLNEKYENFGILAGADNIAKFIKNQGDENSKTLSPALQKELMKNVCDLVTYNQACWPQAYREVKTQQEEKSRARD